MAAVAINTAIAIAGLSLMEGMQVQAVKNVTELVVGDAQLHATGYRAEPSVYNALAQPEAVIASADKLGIGAAPRSYGVGLVSATNKSAGATFWGIDPQRERDAFKLAQRLEVGRFLDSDPRQEVVIGRLLARSLEAKLGDEIVAVVGAADGSMGNELYKIVGILKPVSNDIDRGALLMHHEDFASIFVSGGRVHQVAFSLRGGLSSDELRHALADEVEGDELLSWKELMPAFAEMLQANAAGLWVMGLIFGLAAALGVMNTMLMATHDRVREYGVLKALGTPAWKILRDVAAEAALLALVACAVGVVLGCGAAWYLEVYGIDLSGTGSDQLTFGGVTFSAVWMGYLLPGHVVAAVQLMFGMCVLASLYPGIRVARIDPVKAMTDV